MRNLGNWRRTEFKQVKKFQMRYFTSMPWLVPAGISIDRSAPCDPASPRAAAGLSYLDHLSTHQQERCQAKMAVSTQPQTSYSRSHTGLPHKSGESFRPCVEISRFDRGESQCSTSRRVLACSLHQRLAHPAQMPKRKWNARGTKPSRWLARSRFGLEESLPSILPRTPAARE
jgi:hypothetical protein